MGKGDSKSATTNALPGFLVPYADQFISAYRDQAFVDGKPIGMPSDLNQVVAEFSPEQNIALDQMAQRTGGWQGAADLNTTMAANTIGGGYLHPSQNPYLQSTYDAAAESVGRNFSTAVAPGIMAAGQRAGQFGGSAMNELMANAQGELGDSLGDMATKIYGGNYALERDRQMQASQNFGNTLQTASMPMQTLYGTGAARQEQTQAELDTDYANAAQRAEWPFNILSGYGSAIGQAAGGGGTSTTKTSGSGMFGSVICTELYRRGLMDEATYRADTLFGALLPPEILAGYHRWAIPVAGAMRRSDLLTKLIAPVALCWARHMRYQLTGRGKDSLIGRLAMKLGAPLCAYLGRRAMRHAPGTI